MKELRLIDFFLAATGIPAILATSCRP